MPLTTGDHWQVTGASFTDTNMEKGEVAPRDNTAGVVRHLTYADPVRSAQSDYKNNKKRCATAWY